MATENKQIAEKPRMTMAQYADNISMSVLSDITAKQQRGLRLPINYAATNALTAAIFIIKKTVDKDKNLALAVCKEDSIKQAVIEMLTKGLDPSKKQCYFIVYGDQLTLFESYFGAIHRAKESDPNIKDVYGEVVYQDDKFAYTIKQGTKLITQHEQDPDNVDLDKIKGAYATIVYHDGKESSEYMSWKQIQNSWAKGSTKGQSDAHKLSPEEMSKRTVLNRLLKMTTNTSNDEQLLLGQMDDIESNADEYEATEMVDITPAEKPQSKKQIDKPAQDTSEAPVKPRRDVPVQKVDTDRVKVSEPPTATQAEPQQEEFDWNSADVPDILRGV